MEDGGGTGGRGGRRRRWCGRGGGISGAGAADPAGRGHGQGRLLRAVLHPQAEPGRVRAQGSFNSPPRTPFFTDRARQTLSLTTVVSLFKNVAEGGSRMM
jgi:hypothetical protein